MYVTETGCPDAFAILHFTCTNGPTAGTRPRLTQNKVKLSPREAQARFPEAPDKLRAVQRSAAITVGPSEDLLDRLFELVARQPLHQIVLHLSHSVIEGGGGGLGDIVRHVRTRCMMALLAHTFLFGHGAAIAGQVAGGKVWVEV